MTTTLDTVTLPDNHHWRDEYGWAPVGQAQVRTLTGSLVVEESARTGGRPITLDGMWVTRSTVEALRVLEAQVSTPMTLTLPDARQFTVLFRRAGDRPAVEAKPIRELAPDVYAADDDYSLTLHLMEA